jgi:hypothetical protein
MNETLNQTMNQTMHQNNMCGGCGGCGLVWLAMSRSLNKNGPHFSSEGGNNQHKRVDDNAKENYRHYFLRMTFMVNQTSEPLFLLHSRLCQMQWHFMEVLALLEKTCTRRRARLT